MIFGLVFFILQAAAAQQAEPSANPPPQVAFCEMTAHPGDYDRRLVEFTAIYAESVDGAIFLDGCTKKPEDDIDTIAKASFKPGSYEARKHGTPVDKRFDKLLKKTSSVRVRAVGLFTDHAKKGIIDITCCRYRIEVQKLLDVQKAP
jgi:hypothetical protein